MKEKIVKLVVQSNCPEDIKLGLELMKGRTLEDIPVLFKNAIRRPLGRYSVFVNCRNYRHYAIKLSDTLYAHIGINSVYFTGTPYNIRYNE